jgi:hypothetical protein
MIYGALDARLLIDLFQRYEKLYRDPMVFNHLRIMKIF